MGAALMGLLAGNEIEQLAIDEAVKIGELQIEIMRLRQSIAALIEVYAPAQRKDILRKEHLG